MSPTAARSPLGEGPIPSLDGIRAIAVSLVFFAHGGFEHIVPGGLGVTLFFVLSGFLITTLLRIEHAQRGSVSYRSFYLRRLLRLMPPLILIVAAAAVLSSLALIDGAFSLGGLLSALFYFGNYYLIQHDFHGMPGGIGVVWSLAIEEHYYVFFPPLAVLLLRLGRASWSAVLLSLLCVLVLAWRTWLVLHGGSTEYIMMATDTRVDAILIGCLLALLRNPWLDRPAHPAQKAAATPLMDGALAAASIAVLLLTLLIRDDVFRYTIRYTLQSLAIAALLYLAVARANQRPYRWLNARPLMYLGSISYTIYLSHHVILLGLAKHWPQLNWTALMLLGAILTLAVAEPMRRWVEQPCARLRRRLHQRTLVRTSSSALASAAAS